MVLLSSEDSVMAERRGREQNEEQQVPLETGSNPKEQEGGAGATGRRGYDPGLL